MISIFKKIYFTYPNAIYKFNFQWVLSLLLILIFFPYSINMSDDLLPDQGLGSMAFNLAYLNS